MSPGTYVADNQLYLHGYPVWPQWERMCLIWQRLSVPESRDTQRGNTLSEEKGRVDRRKGLGKGGTRKGNNIWKKKKATKNNRWNFLLKQDLPLEGAAKRKGLTGTKFSNVDDAVYMWYQQKCSTGVPVKDLDLQAAAERFTQCFG